MNADTRQQADTSAMAGPHSPVVLVTNAHAGHANGATPAELLRAAGIVVAPSANRNPPISVTT